LTLKDEILPRRGDGREQSTVSWEVDFTPGTRGGKVWLGWEEFKATYRGREKGDAEPLRKNDIKRISLMMRRYVAVSCYTIFWLCYMCG
jgi:hypothetical protein